MELLDIQYVNTRAKVSELTFEGKLFKSVERKQEVKKVQSRRETRFIIS